MSTYLPNVLSTIQTDAFDHQIDRLLHDAVRTFDVADQTWAPAANAWEDDNGFYVQMALPGWEPTNISLEVDNRLLTVKGAQSAEPNNPVKFHLHEIAGGQFTRRFRLPSFVEQDKASATHKHGLLTITFPKREEAKCRRIMIEEA